MSVEESSGPIYLEYEEARLALDHLSGLTDNEQTRVAERELSALVKERRPGDVTREIARTAFLALDLAAHQSTDNNLWSKLKNTSDRIRAKAGN